jgi:hypothetical protein
MPQRVSKTGSELFIVDNSDEEWKVSRYLYQPARDLRLQDRFRSLA